MLPSAIKLNPTPPPPPPPPPPLRLKSSSSNVIFLLPKQQQQQLIRFSSLSIQSSNHSLLRLTSSVGIGSPPPPTISWNLTNPHTTLFNLVACVVAISTSWLFLSAIPALLACRRAAESLEKLMDVMREELPDTMAAVRLSGMEISDLTMELSDLGQEITKGVRSSTQAVRVAEDRLRRLTTMVPNAAATQPEDRDSGTSFS